MEFFFIFFCNSLHRTLVLVRFENFTMPCTSHDVTVGKKPTVKCYEVIILNALLSVSSATFGQVFAELRLESSVDRTQLKR